MSYHLPPSTSRPWCPLAYGSDARWSSGFWPTDYRALIPGLNSTTRSRGNNKSLEKVLTIGEDVARFADRSVRLGADACQQWAIARPPPAPWLHKTATMPHGSGRLTPSFEDRPEWHDGSTPRCKRDGVSPLLAVGGPWFPAWTRDLAQVRTGELFSFAFFSFSFQVLVLNLALEFIHKLNAQTNKMSAWMQKHRILPELLIPYLVHFNNILLSILYPQDMCFEEIIHIVQ